MNNAFGFSQKDFEYLQNKLVELDDLYKRYDEAVNLVSSGTPIADCSSRDKTQKVRASIIMYPFAYIAITTDLNNIQTFNLCENKAELKYDPTKRKHVLTIIK